MWINMKARNFDIGVDDGYITPWLVPEMAECPGAKARPYPVPNLDGIRKHGFKIKFELEPSVAKGKILKIVWPHFAKLIDYILKDAARRHIRTAPDFVQRGK